MSKDIFSLLSLIGEKVRPSAVIDLVTSSMAASKKPLQQKAVLQWLLSVLQEFGASNVDVKRIVDYLQSPQAPLPCSYYCIGVGKQDTGREERIDRHSAGIVQAARRGGSPARHAVLHPRTPAEAHS